MDDILELFMGMVAVIFGIGVAVFAIACLYVATFSRMACNAMPEQYQVESRFTFWNGCAVKTEQGWIPRDKWESRDIQDRHEVTIKNKP